MRYRAAIEILTSAGIEDAEHDARELFLLFGGGRLPLSRDYCSEDVGLLDAVRRRAGREPLQYIVGRVGFYREEYEVSPACLIPRADTEVLVDYAVKHMPEGARFADLCTGSGCIAVSTLKNTRGTRALAVDISEGALAVAARNAELNSVGDRLELARMDIMRSGEELIGRGIFAVLSNPPYIAEQVYRGLEPELFAEPEIALVGGADGGDFYRRLVPLALSVIDPRGFVALEIGYDQAELLRGLAAESGADIETIKDLGGNDRVAVLRRGQ